MPNSALPENLKGKKHWDWPWPFSLIPRGWTAFEWGMPKIVFGNQKTSKVDGAIPTKHPLPIGEERSWQLSKFPLGPWYAWYFAWSGKRGKDGKFRHFRIGARWDDVDNYVQFPSIAFRKYTGDPLEDTGTK